jgi:hypothetical protein
MKICFVAVVAFASDRFRAANVFVATKPDTCLSSQTHPCPERPLESEVGSDG